MKCEEAEIGISMYIDRALRDTDVPQLFQHLAQCATCRSFLGMMLDLRREIASTLDPEPSRSLDRRILTLRARRAGIGSGITSALRTLWIHRLAVPLPAAAMLALVLLTVSVVSYSLWSKASSEPQKPEVIYMLRMPAVEVQAVPQAATPSH
ncbi:MAG TPA: hypothetical protein VEO56_14005 [Bacteroidota bacterium]|nr:hypothetical protein [Bacteroidota bacterium]